MGEKRNRWGRLRYKLPVPKYMSPGYDKYRVGNTVSNYAVSFYGDRLYLYLFWQSF